MGKLCWHSKLTSYWSYPRKFTTISCTLPLFSRGWRGQKQRFFNINLAENAFQGKKFQTIVAHHVILQVKIPLRIFRRGDRKAASERRRFGMRSRDECDDNRHSVRRSILHWRARLSIISRQHVILRRKFSDKNCFSFHYLHHCISTC